LAVDDQGQLVAALASKTDSNDLTKTLHRTIKKVSEDTEHLRFNTAIATMMEFVNAAYKENGLSKASLSTLVLLVAPYAPHMAEELWQKLGHTNSLAYETWPKFDGAMATVDTMTISVQVNGKMRGTIEVDRQATKDQVMNLAKETESVVRHLEGKTINKEIFVPGKIVNFVVS